jgi:hypothetical protein
MPTTIDLPFSAPVPKGNEVLVVTFELDGKSPVLVHDKTAALVYFPDDLSGPLMRAPELAIDDPVGAITRFPWVVKSAIAGISLGALVSMRLGLRGQEPTTRLVVEPASTQPYR